MQCVPKPNISYYLVGHMKGALGCDRLRAAPNSAGRRAVTWLEEQRLVTGSSSQKSLLRSRLVVVKYPIGSESFIEKKAYPKEQINQ